MPGGERVGQARSLRVLVPDDPDRSTDAPFLAAALDDEIVLLDLIRGRIVLLDAPAARVWQACHTSSTASGAPAGRRAGGILRRLALCGVVIREGNRWTRVPVRWV